jgi:V/A-type H+-transporting ATPase subunit C
MICLTRLRPKREKATRRTRKSYDEVKHNLFEVGGLDEEDFKRILRADANSLINELRRTSIGQRMLSARGKIGRELREGLSARGGSEAAARAEGAIDAYIYLFMDSVLAEVGGKEIAQIREVLKSEVDAKNMMIIERLKQRGIPRERIRACLIEGGKLGEQTINTLMDAKDLSATMSIVKQRYPKLELKAEGKATLPELEVAFEKSIAARKAMTFYSSVLSVGVILGFLLLKEEEVNILRKIAKGKEFHMPENEVRSMLVVV